MLQTAVDSAIGMNDQAVIVDILNILLQKPYVSSRLSGLSHFILQSILSLH